MCPVPFDKSGRFYNNCDGKKYSDRSFLDWRAYCNVNQ